MQETTKEKYRPKILAIRLYHHKKHEFFVDDFINLEELDYLLSEVSCGESDLTPAGKAFINEYYGFTQLSSKIFDLKDSKLLREDASLKTSEDVEKWLIQIEPMDTLTFIEHARGNIDKDSKLRDDLMPPS